jgi:hypothetical protein
MDTYSTDHAKHTNAPREQIAEFIMILWVYLMTLTVATPYSIEW